MRSIIAAAAARSPRQIGRFFSAVTRAAGRSGRRSPLRDAEGLSDHLLGDLGLAPLARAQDSRAHLVPRRARTRVGVVHEIDFAYYGALTQRNG
ncbi:hypothetical protein [Antarcticirhabdus aurantiaca]|uniref:Uncharacterized protein n=1 Tax=Antarcticirhabdus aurantiaca TaxID=2606717 RepID=A0ACD4NUF1_9HYPH|nr:hypothetical protein [Antarcticirhabdus aurantiaca]WAJ30449.1 hypothetical protein OXU80_09705 [Jeongeuplla avenae]